MGGAATVRPDAYRRPNLHRSGEVPGAPAPRSGPPGDLGGAREPPVLPSDPDGRLISGGKNGSLMRVKASYDAAREWLSLRMPDGTVVEGDTSSLGESIVTRFYSRPVRGRVVRGPWADAMTSYL